MALRTILVGSHDRQLEEALRACVSHLTTLSTLSALFSSSAGDAPNVVVIDMRNHASIPPGLSVVRRAHPNAGIVVVASRLDPEMMLEAMRCGVNEFLAEPWSPAELRAAIDRVSHIQPATVAGRIYAFVGAKGGVGTTTLAVNVATALAQGGGGRVLLIDLHLSHGDAALFFGAEPRFSVVDALENTHRLDATFLKGLVAHTRAGVDLMASSDRSLVAAIDASKVRTLLEFAAGHYAHVVLDVPRTDGAMLDALEGSAQVVVVANQELATVRGAARIAATLRQRYGKERVQIVVSRYDTIAEIGQDDIERVTGAAIKHVFPSNYRIAIEALNKGRPIVVENHNKLASSLVGFAGTLAATGGRKAADVHTKSGIFGRLTGRR